MFQVRTCSRLEHKGGEKNLNFGALLKAARRRKGLSQEKLAEKIHRSRSCISKFENNSKTIDLPTFVEWMRTTNATDLMIAGLTGLDPVVISEALRIAAQLMGGG